MKHPELTAVCLCIASVVFPDHGTAIEPSDRADSTRATPGEARSARVDSARADSGQPGRSLTVLTWGGAYEASQRAAYFEPFTRQTGIAVDVERYDGGIDELRRHVDSGDPDWDVIDLVAADAQAACDESLLEPFDPGWLAAADEQSVDDDFDDGAIGDCSVSQLVFSTVLAYDTRAFPDEKPRQVRDFFDIDRFPGKRGLRCAPVAMLEWALLAYDVPYSQVYDLLSTPRGLTLAFRQLDVIRPHLIWWRGGDEPARLLGSGEVVMTSGYNGRFFHAQVIDDAPISVIWDGQLMDHATWAIPRGATHLEEAQAFIRFATRPEHMARQAMHISYGPTRESARRRIGQHVDTGIDMADHLPTSGTRPEHAIIEDSDWYARTKSLRQRRFADWLKASDARPCTDS